MKSFKNMLALLYVSAGLYIFFLEPSLFSSWLAFGLMLFIFYKIRHLVLMALVVSLFLFGLYHSWNGSGTQLVEQLTYLFA